MKSNMGRQFCRYLPVSQRDRLWDLYITAIGWAGEPGNMLDKRLLRRHSPRHSSFSVSGNQAGH